MDVDKWDYFARDFLHLGVTNEFDWRYTNNQYYFNINVNFGKALYEIKQCCEG